MTAVGYPVVSSSFGGRVSPTMAKLSVESVPPPGPMVPTLPDDELLLLAALLELELELDAPDELLLEAPAELELPEQARAQSATASVTHCASHIVEQQYASCAQTVVTQASQPEVSFAPAEHSECAQNEPPVELEAELEEDDVPVVAELDELDELAAVEPPVPCPVHTLVLGMQSSSLLPSEPAIGVQVRSDAHGAEEQSGAQN
jgi:hypothetical protein